MWALFCGYLLVVISLRTAEGNPIFPKHDYVGKEVENVRFKRQFGFPPGFQGSGNNELSGNGIFFDNDNVFNDFVQPTRGRANQVQSTPNPRGPTTVAIPGMGTTRSACEDRCVTTPQYDPVCGDNNITYMNLARFRCAVRCGKNIQIAAYRACPRV